MSLPLVSRVSPHSCTLCPLHQSFCNFPMQLQEAFDGLKTSVTYESGEVVFNEADPCHNVFAVCEGGVKLTISSSEGRSLLLRFARPGEMLGLAEAVLGPGPYGCSAICIEPSILAVIPRKTFLRFIHSYPEACVALTVALSEQYRFAQREAKFLGFGDNSTVRLVHILQGWASERGRVSSDGIHIPLHITHADLAQAIGATRETVTRILGTLTHSGIVERRAEEIVIRHPDELALLGTPAGGQAPGIEESDGLIAQEHLAHGGVS